ncbi:MAG: sensor histidine kinase [Candidatus Hodarchaeales archaeon]
MFFLSFFKHWSTNTLVSPLAILTINQVDPNHLFWLVSNILILLVITGGILLVITGMRRSETLKTGSGPWVISGLAFTLPTILNEIFDELEIILNSDFYPDNLYQFFFTFTPAFLLFAAILLTIGLYRQFLIGEHLHQNLVTKNLELDSQRQELSNFAHTLSHDLRNELSLIQATLDLIDRKKDCDERDIDLLRRRTDLISALLNRSISLADAGLIIGPKNKVNLNKLFQDVSEAVVPSSVKVKVTDVPPVVADREKLYQVIKNILENAVLHSNPKQIDITAETGDAEVQIRIANDGKPIRPEIRGKMFKEDLSDEGLGLKIIQRIIEAHGWKISVNANGRAFIITIPILKNNFESQL